MAEIYRVLTVVRQCWILLVCALTNQRKKNVSNKKVYSTSSITIVPRYPQRREMAETSIMYWILTVVR